MTPIITLIGLAIIYGCFKLIRCGFTRFDRRPNNKLFASSFTLLSRRSRK